MSKNKNQDKNKDKEEKIVLITGGTGFIGSHLASRLLEDDCSVHLVVRSDPSPQQVAGLKNRAHIHTHDGSTQGLINIVTSVKPQSVFHLASLFIAEHASSDLESLVTSNILFGAQLLEAMKVANVRRLINTGTSWQHFHSDHERPSCFYAATKRMFQDLLDFYSDAYGLQAITLKLSDTYGAGDTRRKLFWLLRNTSTTGEVLAMSAGEQEIDLVYIDDVVEAFICAERRLASAELARHEIFAVSSGKATRLRDVVDLYIRISGRKLLINWGARPYRSREVMQVSTVIPGIPGWAPTVDLMDGLQRMCVADRTVVTETSTDGYR